MRLFGSLSSIMSTNTRLKHLAVTRLDLCMFALANATFYALFEEFFVAVLRGCHGDVSSH